MINFAIQFVVILGNLITYAIIIRILLSWINMGGGPRGRFSQIIHEATEPVINLAKRLPHRIGMMDFSALIALLAIDLLVWAVVTILSNLI